jgi:hypothetical protein
MMEQGSVAVTSLILLVDERFSREVEAGLVGNAGCSVLSNALQDGMEPTVWSSTLQHFTFTD